MNGRLGLSPVHHDRCALNGGLTVNKVACLGVVCTGLLMLTGCMHGETFSEWKSQLMDKDPWMVAVVEPNDTKEDETNREFLDEVRVLKEKRGNFQREARVLPSQNVTAFLNSPRAGGKEANRRLLVAYAGKLMAGFAGIRDFKIIGTEDETIAQLSAPAIGAQAGGNTAHILSFNILSLSSQRVQKTLLGAPVVANGQPLYCYTGEMSASVALINPQGEQRMNLTASVKVNGQETAEQAQQALIDAAVVELVRQYSERTSPPAYVSQLRGNGLFAEITLGSEYGVAAGNKIEFYRNEKVPDFVTGKPTVRKSVVATGVVSESRFVSENTSWVKIDLHHLRNVHLGTFARVMRSGE